MSHHLITNWRKSSRSVGDGNCVEIGWTETDWRKSSWSAGGGECVEVGRTDAFVGFRDTKEAHLPADERSTLVFGRAAGAAFLASLRSAVN